MRLSRAWQEPVDSHRVADVGDRIYERVRRTSCEEQTNRLAGSGRDDHRTGIATLAEGSTADSLDYHLIVEDRHALTISDTHSVDVGCKVLANNALRAVRKTCGSFCVTPAHWYHMLWRAVCGKRQHGHGLTFRPIRRLGVDAHRECQC